MDESAARHPARGLHRCALRLKLPGEMTIGGDYH
jgi:hypothetical protein